MKRETWPVYIYGIFAPQLDGQLRCLYVGQTANPPKRERGHILSGDQSGRIFKIIGWTDSAHACAMERDFILAYKAAGQASQNTSLPNPRRLKRKPTRFHFAFPAAR